ncbi:MAG: beta-ketoacyl synthase N-terminal-like domain-containing protein [Akkermansiaceae bacterium]
MGTLSALGHDLESHLTAISSGGSGIRPLAELLGKDSPHAHLHGAWITPRELLNHRKWSPVTMAALHVAKQAAAEAGWTKDELASAALVVGTSRGNAAGWLGEWPNRRPFKLMAASNTIHSEPATAISIELGIYGINHVVASGCSAGLDALGIAKLLIDSGQAERALVVAVDLPLVPLLLDNYAASGLLSTHAVLDPYNSNTNGFIPGEGAAAIALSAAPKGKLRLTFFTNNSDGADPVGIPKDGGRSKDILKKAIATCGNPTAICPHATGTQTQAHAESHFLNPATLGSQPSLHILKPFIGHTVGASGLIESAILLAFMRQDKLPPNLSGTSGLGDLCAPAKATSLTGPVFKLAHGMGGHNAIAVFQKIS